MPSLHAQGLEQEGQMVEPRRPPKADCTAGRDHFIDRTLGQPPERDFFITMNSIYTNPGIKYTLANNTEEERCNYCLTQTVFLCQSMLCKDHVKGKL